MPTYNWSVGLTYADSGVTGAKDLNVQNLRTTVVEYVVASAQPLESVAGLQVVPGVTHPVKLGASEKLWLRILPAQAVAATVGFVVAVEVP